MHIFQINIFFSNSKRLCAGTHTDSQGGKDTCTHPTPHRLHVPHTREKERGTRQGECASSATGTMVLRKAPAEEDWAWKN